MCNAGGWSCAYPPEVETVQGIIRTTETLCDGIDGNCDGDVDEWFTTLGDSCSDLRARPVQGLRCRRLRSAGRDADDVRPWRAAAARHRPAGGLRRHRQRLQWLRRRRPARDRVRHGAGPGRRRRHCRPLRGVAPRRDRRSSRASWRTSPARRPTSCPGPAAGTPRPRPPAQRAARASGCAAMPSWRRCAAARATPTIPTVTPYDGDACNGVDANIGQAVPTGTIASCAAPPGAGDRPLRQRRGVDQHPDQRAGRRAGSHLRARTVAPTCRRRSGSRARSSWSRARSRSTLLANIGFRCCKDP